MCAVATVVAVAELEPQVVPEVAATAMQPAREPELKLLPLFQEILKPLILPALVTRLAADSQADCLNKQE